MNPDELLSADERAVLAAGATESEPAEQATDEPAAETVEAVEIIAEAVETAAQADEAPAVFAPTYETAEPPASTLADLRTKGRELRKKWADGEIDDEAYNTESERLEEARDAAVGEQVAARVKNELSESTNRQSFEFQRNVFLKSAERTDGVPYLSNETVRAVFNRELSRAGKAAVDANNKDITAEELFTIADKAVRDQFAAIGATFGKKLAVPAAKPAPAGNGPRLVPKTLAGLPAAAAIDTGSEAHMAQLATLEGEDYEIAVAKLPADQRRRMLEQAG